MEHADWLERWREGRTPFHVDRVNPWLTRFAGRLDLAPGRSALVPLCGKSLDMGYLARQGVAVTGVDVAEEALRQFLATTECTAARQVNGAGIFLRAEPYTLVAADMLSLTAAQIGRFDIIWDRAALIALPPATRPRYMRRLLSLLKPAGRLLLVGMEYDSECMDGPPFSVSTREIKKLLGKSGQMELLAQEDLDADEPVCLHHDLPWIRESVYLITATVQEGEV